MGAFEKAVWIWYSEESKADDYGELYSIAEYTGGQAELCACG